jgi:hypothetical protein
VLANNPYQGEITMAEQGTLEWKLERCGKVTASKVWDIINKNKSGTHYAERANYAYSLALETLTGVPEEIEANKYMIWGSLNEPIARSKYQEATFDIVTEVGFIPHPTILRSGASPDGLVGDDGLIEVKCPQTKTHCATLVSGQVPKNYLTQMCWQMACMPERQWNDFVSFDPRMPEKGQMFVKRVYRKDQQEYIEMLEEEVKRFLREDVDNVVSKIKEAMEKL